MGYDGDALLSVTVIEDAVVEASTDLVLAIGVAEPMLVEGGKKDVRLGKSVRVAMGPVRAEQVTEASWMGGMSRWDPEIMFMLPSVPMKVQLEVVSFGMME